MLLKKRSQSLQTEKWPDLRRPTMLQCNITLPEHQGTQLIMDNTTNYQHTGQPVVGLLQTITAKPSWLCYTLEAEKYLYWITYLGSVHTLKPAAEEIRHLWKWKLNWKYIVTTQCVGWPGQGHQEQLLMEWSLVDRGRILEQEGRRKGQGRRKEGRVVFTTHCGLPRGSIR